jgi:ATP-dependent RNA circularization protein (DNA/RNA ligase family)
MTKVRFFDVFNTKTMRYLNYDERVVLITELGLDPVPELYRGVWDGKEKMYPFAEGLTTLGGKHIREGWVLNTLHERYEPRLDSRMQVKLVGEGYNLQK